MKGKINGWSAMASLIAGVLSLLITIIFVVYGVVNQYFDLAIVLCDLVAVAGFLAYALVDKAWSEYAALLGVLTLSYSIGLFFLNSYTVWADWYGNFNMYGSRGGVVPVIIQLVLMIAAAVFGIISCFTRKGGKNA